MDDSWPMVMSSNLDLARFYRFTTVVPSGGYVGRVFPGSGLSGGLGASCVRGGPGCAPVFATGGPRTKYPALFSWPFKKKCILYTSWKPVK